MDINTVCEKLSFIDKGKKLVFRIENNNLICSFVERKDVIINVFTPFEMRLIDKGIYTDADITQKYFELLQIANFKI